MPSSTQPITPTIYLNGRFFSQRVTGIQRYARETLLALDKLIANQANLGFKLTLLIPKGVCVPTFMAVDVEEYGWFQGHLWEQIDLPRRVGGGLLFSFGPTGPLIKKHQIITIHDLAVYRIPEAFSRLFRMWYQLVYSVIARRSKLLMTVSKFSAEEINQCLGVPIEKTRISTEGWQHLKLIVEDAAILKKFELGNKPFVLAVSSPTPNKNFSTIVKAFKLLGSDAPYCVAAGKADIKVFSDVGVSMDSIQPLGYVTDAELKCLYKHAACFIFPSFYEGFGIPPLEAMACGCPILAADIPAVKEVCGESALYFDPHRPDQLAALVQEIMANMDLRQTLSLSSLAQAEKFSWEQGALLNLAALKEALHL
jgi:glycosyltransferase involved in cell wall biosynthesis